jgi:glycosyltransferase involved in cell wall biosynthesis
MINTSTNKEACKNNENAIPKKILLLSAYDAASHKLWRQRLTELLPQFQWIHLSLPPRNFAWKIRGNSLLWAQSERDLLEQHYDLLLATSMVDLASLRGFVPSLGSIPTIVYFHENQFEYPIDNERKESRAIDNIEPKLVPIYSALCANKILFNSNFNRDSFLEGVRKLFKKLPDKIPEAAYKALQKSEVLAVPIGQKKIFDFAAKHQQEKANKVSSNQLNRDQLQVVWNHRWEYDKGPDLLLEVLRILVKRQLPIVLQLAGEKFRHSPLEFEEICNLISKQASYTKSQSIQCGYIEGQSTYYTLLCSVDVVLSTALHDFQGLAIQEACLAGCTPLVPDDLAYPEYFCTAFRYQRCEQNTQSAANIVARLLNWQKLKSMGTILPKAELSELADQKLSENYQKIFLPLITAEKD